MNLKLKDIKTQFFLVCVLLIFVIIIIICWSSNSDPTLVKTESGKIRGIVLQASYESKYNYSYYAFLGIPYARPPVGPLRFKDPKPVKSWSDVRNASRFGSICPQRSLFIGTPRGQDDCLFLNVYSKHVGSYKRQPVMVWIHGGGFTIGSGNAHFYGPQYLLRKDIVLVTINYRLGALGFLNLGDEEAPGNQGLKDQVMALKWVKKNILNFGGDPDSVTIFGESAGSASVHYLTLSPLARGLFHKAIAQSGLANNFWASNPNPRIHAIEFARRLGCSSEDATEIVKFLRNVSSNKLIEIQNSITTPKEKTKLIFPFCPGIDEKSKHPFLTKPVDEMIKSGVSVPFLFGYTSREGLSFTPPADQYSDINENFEDYLHPAVLKMLRSHNLTADNLRSMYFGQETISLKDIGRYADFWGDLQMVYGVHEFAKYQIKNNYADNYLYRFEYDKGFSLTKTFFNIQLPGAAHADELGYLFSFGLFPSLSKNNESSYRLMEQMTELWTNFARTGNPTPKVSDLIRVKWRSLKNYHSLDSMSIKEDLQPIIIESLLDKFSKYT